MGVGWWSYPFVVLSVVPTQLDGLRASRGRSRRGAFFVALAVQGALLGISVFVVVKEEVPVEAPAFSGERTVTVEERREERADRMRQLKRRMERPKTFLPLAVERSFESDLPAVAALPLEDLDAVGEAMDPMLAGEGLLDTSGLEGLVGQFAAGESAARFFGVADSGRRIVIVVNTSASVARKAAGRGVSVEAIQEEVVGLVAGLDRNTLFGVVQFSQGVRGFSEELAPALAKNKRSAEAWVREELRGNPPVEDERLVGHEAALAAAFGLQPDLVFLVTDGSLNRRTRKAGGGWSYPKISFDALLAFCEREVATSGVSPRVHVVGFELGESEREGLRRLASRFGGSLREF